jgi:importin-4
VGLLRHFTGSEEKFPWEKGLPVKKALPSQVNEYLDQVIFPHYFQIFETDDNKEVIEKTLECVREMCEVFGPGAIVNHSDKLVETILMLLDKKAYCQTKGKEKDNGMQEEDEEDDGFKDDEEEEEDDDDEEDMDHDEIILGNTTDVIIELARALGDQFLGYLTRIGPSLVRYLDDSHPKSDIVMVIGCLAETFIACTAAIPVYFKDFLQILLKNA